MNFAPEPPTNNPEAPTHSGEVNVGSPEVVENIPNEEDRQLVKDNLSIYREIDEAVDNEEARQIVNRYSGRKFAVADRLFHINKREKARYN